MVVVDSFTATPACGSGMVSDHFRGTGALSGLPIMKLHGIQFRKWPLATVIKSLGLEATEPGP